MRPDRGKEISTYSASKLESERLTNRTVDDGTRISTISVEPPKMAIGVLVDGKLTRWQVSPSEMRSATLGLAIAAEAQGVINIIRHPRSSCVDCLKFASIVH
jgi:hypothetical protein